jgi:hypothetical protein
MEEVPAVGEPDPGAPRDPPHHRGRGHHRAARPGGGQRGGTGTGRAMAAVPKFGPELVDHYTFVLCSDGDLEEGISPRGRARWPATWGSGRLIYVYDDNHISIDGPTELAYTDNVPERFSAYGWHTENIGEVANDTEALEAAVRRAMAVEDQPSMISLRSHIGWPAPDVMDTAKAHGSPLGEEEIAKTKDDPRPPARRVVLGPRRGPRLLPGLHHPGPEAAGRRGGRASRPGQGDRARPGRRARPGTGCGRLGRRSCPRFEAGRGDGHPAGRQRGNQRHRRSHPRSDGRIGRPDREQRCVPRGRGGPGVRQPRWGSDPLRHPGARHGRA